MAVDQNYLNAQFPLIAGLIDAIPELKDWANSLIAQGVDVGSAAGKAQAQQQLYGTQWYRTQSDSQRAWQLLQQTDPAQAQTKIAAAWSDIHSLAGQMGWNSGTFEQLNDLVTKQIAFGFDDTQLRSIIGQYLQTANPQSYGGQAAANAGSLQQIASAYGLPMADPTIQSWVSRIASGADTVDGFTNYAKQQAKLVYAGLGQQIDAGQTVKDVANTYTQQMANLLEVNPESIDWANNPLIKQALQFKPQMSGQSATANAQQGAVGTMPMYQFEQLVKQDPRWLNTNNAKQGALSAIQQIGKDWGFSSA